ncbi:hypothetical protein Q8F55_000684 [Vanrija albida]|uniref:GDP/GTP exchange factor Sec2 N-terminal domain-containing protein n=1 Tax=Vanrija albida TaxID=181172 RepID=A0ABR3QDY7_9TREE
MSAPVETDTRRAQKVTAAKKKLKQFRAARAVHSLTPSWDDPYSSPMDDAGLPTPLNASTIENAATLPRRMPSYTKADLDATIRGDMPSFRTQRHSRSDSRTGEHRRQLSSFSFSRPLSTSSRPSIAGVFDDVVEGSNHSTSHSVDLGDDGPAAPNPGATPTIHTVQLVLERDEQEITAVKARMGAFTFGSKPAPGHQRLLPSVELRDSFPPPHSRTSPRTSPPLPFNFPASLGAPTSSTSPAPSTSRSNSPPQPTQQRRRHSHNRSESISLPNLKLGRPSSLGVSSPVFPPSPSTPEPSSRSSRFHAALNGSRLKFEPSDKEKEESRRRALDKLTGSVRVEEPRYSAITLPDFDDDDDDMSITSSRPPSGTVNSTASSSRPSSITGPSTNGSFNGSATSPLPWSGFEDTDRWSYPQRFDAKDEAAAFAFDVSGPTKTSSVLLNSHLGVLTEEDETESDTAEDTDNRPSTTSSFADAPSLTDDESAATSGPTPSKLRELHLVSSVSSAGSRRSSVPDVREGFARALAQSRETPTKGYGTIGRGRPRPLGLEGVTSLSLGSVVSAPSPVKGARARGVAGPAGRRVGQPGSRSSSISYKRDESGSNSSRDLSRGPTSPPPMSDVSSPTYTHSPLGDWQSRSIGRPCPRPRSLVQGLGGTSGRVLGEVEEEAPESPTIDFRPPYDARDDGVSNGRASTEASRDSVDDTAAWQSNRHDSWPASQRDSWTASASRRDSRDRLDAEMEREALRDDVDMWRRRCRTLEDKLESERRDAAVLRERVRKLGDRLLSVSNTAPSNPAADERHLVAEMRDQIFSLTAALERERKDKLEAQARIAELQTNIDAFKTPQVSTNSLPATPKSRPHRPPSLSLRTPPHAATPPGAKYADADEPEHEATPPSADDPSYHRMKGWGFPRGRIDRSERDAKAESFFGLSRPRAVRAGGSGSGLGLAWPNTPADGEFDLPPFVVNADNSSFVVPVSPTEASPEPTVRIEPPVRIVPHRGVDATPPRPPASALSFLSDYLPLPRATPPSASSGPIPRISITPSSVSPKRRLAHLPAYEFSAEMASAARTSCDVDFAPHGCKRCTGEIIIL